MSEEQPSLQIDTDWKKQAQEEKKRLAEEQQKRQIKPPAAPPVAPPGLVSGAAPAAPAAPARGRGRAGREMPQASFSTLVQSLLTQSLFYLGELAPAGGEGSVDLDRAKLQIDTLGVLEEKTANNLTAEEKHMLDAALYETRARFVSVASQFI